MKYDQISPSTPILNSTGSPNDPESLLPYGTDSRNEDFIQIQNGLSFPPYEHCCGCSKSPNLVGLFLNLLLWLAILLNIVNDVFELMVPHSHLTLSMYFLAIFGGVYLFYLIDVFLTSTCKYLHNMDFVEDFSSCVDYVMNAPPEIGFHCECYHYETRTRSVSKTDSNGNSYTETETYDEKVTTHQESEAFIFVKWEDISGGLTNEVRHFYASKIKFSKSWVFGDDKTRYFYEGQKNSFILRNKDRDSYFDFQPYFRINGFKERKLCVVDCARKSGWMSYGRYLIVSLLLMSSWPYRIWLENNTVRSRYHFCKRIYT